MDRVYCLYPVRFGEVYMTMTAVHSGGDPVAARRVLIRRDEERARFETRHGRREERKRTRLSSGEGN